MEQCNEETVSQQCKLLILIYVMSWRLIFWVLVLGLAWNILHRCDIIWQRALSSERSYRVRNIRDANHAAEHLERLTRRIEKLLDSPVYAQDGRIKRIRARWNGTLTELDGEKAGNIAHSLGKRSISICIRDPDGSLSNENACMFVVLHELAHIATPSIGHTKEFWDNMKFLLEMAEITGVYHYKDHDREHVTLCGKTLGSNPMTCIKDKTCHSMLIQTQK